MPFIHITLGKPVSSAVKQHIGRQATDLIVDLLGKRREVTAVLVEVVHAGAWCISGEPLSEAATPTHCEIVITAGTNSAEEKARMIAAMHAMLAAALATVPEATYVVIHELPASDWGYAGKTQSARRMTASAL